MHGLLAAMLLLAPAGAADALATCDALRDTPRAVASCYKDAWRGGADADLVADRVRSADLGGWGTFVLAEIESTAARETAGALYDEADRALREAGEAEGELHVSLARSTWHARMGAMDDALAAAKRSVALAQTLGDPALSWKAEAQLARVHSRRAEGDEARAIAERLEPLLFPGAACEACPVADLGTRTIVVYVLYGSAYDHGDYAEALHHSERLEALLEESGDQYALSGILAERLGLVLNDRALIEAVGLDALRALGRRALELATGIGYDFAITEAQCYLGQITAGDEGEALLRACFDPEEPDPLALARLAERVALRDPDEGLALNTRALELTVDDPFTEARILGDRGEILAQAGLRAEAIVAFERASDVVQRHIASLGSESDQARIRGSWDEVWYRLAALHRDDGDLAAAFRAVEGPRGQLLLGPDVAPELADLQAALGPDEAALLYYLPRYMHDVFEPDADDEARAWVLVVSRDEARAVVLEPAWELEQAVRLGAAVFQEPAPPEATVDALRRRVLADALAVLPEPPRRLVVVPEGALDAFPFAAVLPDVPIEIAPAAGVWLRLRDRPQRIGPPLVFADARADRDALAAAGRDPGPLPPLPRARDEAAHLAAWGGIVHLGEDATELAVVAAPLDGVGVLHFAVHAVADPDWPERSALFLTPTDGTDGALTAGEVEALKLDGHVVVLSACRSASGEVVRGEGVLGLARAFFRAGASAVVAPQWPVRDDEAEALVAAFYERLDRGDDLTTALHGAQAERRGAGAASTDWAGWVVLGDGSRRPLPPRSRRGALLIAGGLLLCAVGLITRWVARRRT